MTVTYKLLSAICSFQCMKFDSMWGRMEIEAWHTLIVPTIYISGHEMLFLKKPTYWEEYDLESCYDNLKVNVLLFQNIQAGNYWIVFAHIDLINYLYKALNCWGKHSKKLDKSMCCNSHSTKADASVLRDCAGLYIP